MSVGFFGREQEFASLELGLDHALAGRTRLALLSGEPGIGKTRLAEEFSARARARGCLVAWGRAWEAGGAPAFWPWLEVLRELRGGQHESLAELVPGFRAPEPSASVRDVDEGARFRLFEATAAVLEGARAPLLVVIDDLHAADSLSVLFLTFLARSRRHVPLLVLGTYRDNEARLHAEIGPLLAHAAREALLVPLGRLGADDTTRLFRAQTQRAPSPQVLSRVFATTEGNPLFVAELARSWSAGTELREAGPWLDGIRQAIAEHLAQLDAATRELLRVASVFGREFSRAELAEIARLSLDETESRLSRAFDAGVLRARLDPAQNAGFSHILVREQLYRELSVSRCSELHATVGAALLQKHGELAGEYSAVIAHHFLLATPSVGVSQAVIYAARAAAYAFEKLAFEDAAALYTQALDVLPADAPVLERATLLAALGEAQQCSGRVALGRAACVRAAALASEGGDAALLARAALCYASEYGQGARDEEMVRLLREAAHALGPEDSLLTARVGARLSSALLPCRDTSEPAALGERALAMARRLDDPATLLFVLDAAGGAIFSTLNARERAAYVRESTLIDRVDRRNTALLHAQASLPPVLLVAGQFAEAEQRINEFLVATESSPQPRVITWALTLKAQRASLHGRHAEVKRHLDDLEALAERYDYAPALRIADRSRALLAIELLDREEMTRARERLEPKLPYEFALRAMLDAALGDREAAIKATREWSLPLNVGGAVSRACLLADLIILLGDRERARSFLPVVESFSDECWVWGLMAGAFLGSVARRLGSLCALLERWEDAERWFRAALATEADFDEPLGRSEFAFSAALLSRGRAEDRERARALSSAALARFERLGMVELAELARGRLSQLAVPAPIQAPSLVADAGAGALS